MWNSYHCLCCKSYLLFILKYCKALILFYSCVVGFPVSFILLLEIKNVRSKNCFPYEKKFRACFNTVVSIVTMYAKLGLGLFFILSPAICNL